MSYHKAIENAGAQFHSASHERWQYYQKYRHGSLIIFLTGRVWPWDHSDRITTIEFLRFAAPGLLFMQFFQGQPSQNDIRLHMKLCKNWSAPEWRPLPYKSSRCILVSFFLTCWEPGLAKGFTPHRIVVGAATSRACKSCLQSSGSLMQWPLSLYHDKQSFSVVN